MSANTGASQSSRQTLSRSWVNFLRTGRHLAYRLLAPIDYLSRLVNGKTDFPPLHLRRYVGPLRTFESSGAEFVSYLKLLVNLQSNERILDIGCGCGLMALYLKDVLEETGGYVGVDIYRPAIEWCRRHIGSKHHNFQFDQIDVRSLAYNPNGQIKGDSFVFPYDAESFDVVLLKSVFTHMRPAEVENYVKEIARLLNENGRCLATFFLLNQEQEVLAAEGRNDLEFSFGTDQWRYVYEHSPESASAYDEEYILSLLERHGLRLQSPIYYGTWSGRDGLSFQDMMIIEKDIGGTPRGK